MADDPNVVAPALELNLARELEQLDWAAEWRNGQQTKMLAKYPDLRIVLIALKAHAQLAEHQAPARISIQPLRGRIHVRAAGRAFDLPAGSLLTLERGLRHSVEAIDDSAFLLTIAGG